MKKELIQEYEKLQKKYKLPSFEEFNKEFEICALDLDTSGILVRALLRVISSKLSLFLNYLEPVVSPPNQTIHSMIETQYIADEHKKEMFEFYKEIAFLLHEITEIELLSEKEVAEYINKLFKSWPKLKKTELKYLKIIKQSWKEEEKKEENSNNYTG